MEGFYQRKLSEIETIADDEERIYAFNTLVTTYLDSPSPERLQLLYHYLELAKRKKLRDAETTLHFNLYYILAAVNEKEKAQGHLEEGKALLQHCRSPEARMYAHLIISYAHWFAGEFDIAFEKVFAVLHLENEIGPRGYSGNGWCNYSLGIFYFDTKDFSKSIQYYSNAQAWFEKSGDGYGIARSRNGIASGLIALGKFLEAKTNLLEILSVYREYEASSGESRALTDLGIIEKHMGNYEEAMRWHEEAYVIRRKNNHVQGLITSLTEIGTILFHLKKYEPSFEKLKEAEQLAISTNTKSKLYTIQLLLANTCRELNEPWQALEYLEKSYELKALVVGEQANLKVNELHTKFATAQSEKEAEIHRLKNIELRKAYDLIENKNREILDSIKYAKRIQVVLLPSDRLVGKLLLRARKQN
jgi:tetratricopeptide (TPR) repeat protein